MIHLAISSVFVLPLSCCALRSGGPLLRSYISPYSLPISTPPTPHTGVQQTILAGGDSGSRGLFVGAVQAARAGRAVDAIPSDWMAKTAAYGQAEDLVGELMQQRRRDSSPGGQLRD